MVPGRVGTNYTIRRAPDALRVELYGALDVKGATELEAELTAMLNGSPEQGVLFVMQGLSDCVEAARKVLVQLQQRLMKSSRRTAYVDDRARFRGMALWVMHLAQDPNAKAVATVDQGLKWLGVAEARESDASRRVGT